MDTSNSNPIIINKRYQLLKRIGQGGMGVVYRAYDRFNQQTVALKLIAVDAMVLDFSTKAKSTDLRLALAGEFRTLSSLRHPNIISVLDYGFDEQKRPFYTMELLENAETILQAAKEQSYSERLQLLAQTLHAMDFLHRRGIIHRDLKPENILVSNGTVRILDFGLALEKSAADEHEDTAGTMYYLAPELMSAGRPSIASDMYALGVVAYELFAGKLPFPSDNIGKFILSTLSESPDMTALEAEEPLRQMIAQLLAKKPADRNQDVHGMLKTLTEMDSSLAAYDSSSIRESFLQSAAFTGRDAEMNQLLSAMNAMIGGQASSWFIAGESGIGKSRLMDEIRTHALVSGVQVLRGQAISEGGQPYALWLNILRHLLLISEADDLEAAIFKPMIPDIEALLERPIPTIPMLAPSAERSRFISSITSLVQRIQRPSLIILEDLHWASQESLQLLKMLISQSKGVPLMILGSYRADEANELLKTMEDVQEILLKRLPHESIESLSVGMIGEIAHEEQIVNLLERESEGNIYFLIEIIRALAEEAGHLEEINRITLPAQILTGGMLKLLRRRLNRVAEKTLPLLRIAAVAGRRLDLEVLEEIIDSKTLADALEDSANALVLEFFEGEWRFVHDKLRETILSDLSPERRLDAHQKLARALEKRRGEVAAAALVYHWGMADNREREAYWANFAGSNALQSGAYNEAIAYLYKAVQYQNSYRLQRQLGQAFYGLGDLKLARQHLDEALTLLGQSLPKQYIPSILRQVLRHAISHRGIKLKPKLDDERLIEGARIYGLLGEISYFTTETMLGVYSVLKMLNLASQTQESSELAQAYINMCIAAGLIPHYRLAEYYGDSAERIARHLGDAAALMRILNIYAVYLVGTGQWQRAKKSLDEAYEIATTIGDKREGNQTFTTRAVMLHYQGKLEEAAETNSRAEQAARQIGNQQQLGWGIYSRAENLNNMARYQESRDLLNQYLSMIEEENSKSSRLRVLAAQSIAHFRLDEKATALEIIAQARNLLGKTSPNVYSMLESYAAFGDIALSIAEEEKTITAQNSEKIEDGLRILKQYARLYPIGIPRSLLWQGRKQALLGKPEKAKALYQKALEKSRELAMAYEEKLILGYLQKLGNCSPHL